jgi:hypothetical protein
MGLGERLPTPLPSTVGEGDESSRAAASAAPARGGSDSADPTASGV